MSAPHLSSVRLSRDGDQFHYLWAARRCLHLLSVRSGLAAVTIEGSSTREVDGQVAIPGEQVIDVAEYFGNEDPATATRVRYLQLKHSTVRAAADWTPGEMENTLKGFAARFKYLAADMDPHEIAAKVEFGFVSNRPVGSQILEAIADAAAGSRARHPTVSQKLKKITGLRGQALSIFCSMLRVYADEDPYWDQHNLLFQEVAGYLPGADSDAPVQLKDLVARYATSEHAADPAIRKVDVLRALKTDEARLFPAPNQIEQLSHVVLRKQEASIIADIVAADRRPVVIHADGGVGKSILASRISDALPAGSECVVYDCFGNGRYRSASGYRHRHKDALVQIANELASRGLCHPLIPTAHDDPSAYLRAFLYRVDQAVRMVKASNAAALLCIVVDAADNAQIAAEEINEPRAFIRDLLREHLPVGVRLVATARTHRLDRLDLPVDAVRLPLQPFDEGETAAHLRTKFPDASSLDIAEFHRLSSWNPRVQALALAESADLEEILRMLGPNPTTIDDAIARLLERAIAKLRDEAPIAERQQIDEICVGLATLRPLVPIAVLATISGVNAAAIRSFAFDIGRPLLLSGETLQFLDEPAETWFRERFRPAPPDLMKFVQRLVPLASSSAYVAATLPPLMLEAGHVDDLVTMALGSTALPDASPVERRDIELQRLQFALKACLQARRYPDAAKLALKAAGETAGNTRQQSLIQENTDLASAFMNAELLSDLVSRRLPESGWTGSHFAYEAALLSERKELVAEARGSLRMASEWLWSWSRLSKEDRSGEELVDADIAAFAIAHLNIHGPTTCAQWLRGWRPREVSFRVGRLLAARLVDAGRYEELFQLAIAAQNDVCLILAINLELRLVQRQAPTEAILRTLRLLRDRRITPSSRASWQDDEKELWAVTELVAAAVGSTPVGRPELADLLSKYLPAEPPRGLGSRYGKARFQLLHAYALRAALLDERVELADLAHTELRAELLGQNNRNAESREAREFSEDIGSLVPWHQLWADIMVGRVAPTLVNDAITKAASQASQAVARSYSNERHTLDEIAGIWIDILIETTSTDTVAIALFRSWMNGQPRPLSTTTLSRIGRKAARAEGFHAFALECAARVFNVANDERTTADAKAESFVAAARAIVTIAQADAAAYFDHAVVVASKVGDENLVRWAAVLDLADRAARAADPSPELAYRLARCAELTYEYVVRDKHFDWEGTVRAIAGLSPPSAFAILSRWRDRRFGHAARLLPVATTYLVKGGELDGKTALALIGFRSQWGQVELLESALGATSNADQASAVWDHWYHYFVLSDHSADTWAEVRRVVAAHSLPQRDVPAFSRAAAEEWEVNKSRQVYDGEIFSERRQRGELDWQVIFAAGDPSDADLLGEAYSHFRATAIPYDHEEFFRQACGRVRPGREPEFIRAITSLPEFSAWLCRMALEQLPNEWAVRPAVKAAVTDVIKAVCSHDWTAFVQGRSYQALPFALVTRTSGLTSDELIGLLINAAASATDIVAADDLFALVGVLAEKMAPDVARDVLGFGLGLFEDALTESDADGAWRSALFPPLDTTTALAGYVWAALGAPEATVRWEAAHVVRGFAAVGDRAAIGALVHFAQSDGATAFTDSRLFFYRLHATQWLVLALARAAMDRPDVIAAHIDFLISLALEANPHVIIREWAARAALQLLLTDEDANTRLRADLHQVNESPFPPILTGGRFYRVGDEGTNGDDADPSVGAHEKFWFGLDADDYQFAPLGRCFGVSKAFVEREALKVVRHDWNCQLSGRWDSDERQRLGIIKDGESGTSREPLSRTDGLQAYLCYHATMIAAGRLLARLPQLQDDVKSEGEFSQWMKRYDLSRTDGRWVADRRDPRPPETLGWATACESAEWPWSTRTGDFGRELFSAGRTNVWGSWTRISGDRAEVVRIESALVSRENAQALLRALQTAVNHNYYRIPSAGDELEIDSGSYRLIGWVSDDHNETTIESFDPWAGDIRYPALAPADFIRQMLPIVSDTEGRTWSLGSTSALWSASWGAFADGDTEVEKGARLQASRAFLRELLQETGMEMIVEVDIHRRWAYSRFASKTNERVGPMPMRVRLFLIQADGNVVSI